MCNFALRVFIYTFYVAVLLFTFVFSTAISNQNSAKVVNVHLDKADNRYESSLIQVQMFRQLVRSKRQSKQRDSGPDAAPGRRIYQGWVRSSAWIILNWNISLKRNPSRVLFFIFYYGQSFNASLTDGQKVYNHSTSQKML